MVRYILSIISFVIYNGVLIGALFYAVETDQRITPCQGVGLWLTISVAIYTARERETRFNCTMLAKSIFAIFPKVLFYKLVFKRLCGGKSFRKSVARPVIRLLDDVKVLKYVRIHVLISGDAHSLSDARPPPTKLSCQRSPNSALPPPHHTRASYKVFYTTFPSNHLSSSRRRLNCISERRTYESYTHAQTRNPFCSILFTYTTQFGARERRHTRFLHFPYCFHSLLFSGTFPGW